MRSLLTSALEVMGGTAHSPEVTGWDVGDLDFGQRGTQLMHSDSVR